MKTQTSPATTTCPKTMTTRLRAASASRWRLLWAAVLLLPALGAQAGVVLTTLHSFGVFTNGSSPCGGLVQDSDGNIYGTTSSGGTHSAGTVLEISTNGALTSLYSFTGANNGAQPTAELVRGSDGNFYGTTSFGGAGGAGTVFRLTIVPAAPVFQPVSLTNGMLSLTWSTEAGETYQLQHNSDLTSTNWTNLGSAATATGATLSATDTVANGPPRFFRVALLP